MKKLIFIICASIIFTACGRFSNKEEKSPGTMRIVSVSKHLTEMVYALGQGKSLVAVDLSSKVFKIDAQLISVPNQKNPIITY